MEEMTTENRILQNTINEICKLKIWLIKLKNIPLIEKDADHNDALWYSNKLIKKRIKKLKKKLYNEKTTNI
jgi:hypothetical protein